MTIKEKENKADKYNITPKEHIRSLEEQATSNKGRVKKVKLTYKEIKTNMAMLQRITLLENTRILDARGEYFNASEEEIFKVIMVGRKTDDYLIEVKVDDLVMITNFATHMHLPETEAKTIDGKDASYYLVVSLNDIAAKVEYSKL